MKATIKDVARAAGVSPSTVSRALHDNPRISEAVRARIKQVAQEMDFHPNQMARSLVSRKTRIVGIIFPGDVGKSLGNPFYPVVLQGLGHAASMRRHHMLLITGSEEVSSAEASLEVADSGYVSGLIRLMAEDASATEPDVPMVVIGHPVDAENRYCVDNDNPKAGYDATRYLLDKGHRRIMLLGYNKTLMFTVDRLSGYRRALEEVGLPFVREWVLPAQAAHDTQMLQRLFGSDAPPTAVVCLDDSMAIELTSTLKTIGLRVPEDVSLVAFNNTETGRCHSPALTSFDVDPYRLGTHAMDLMLDVLKGLVTEPCSIEVPIRLIERDSVAAIGPAVTK